MVGAGPGDPELITVKAARLIKDADVILYDRLISNDTLNLAKDVCELIYVGKHPGEPSISQERINKILVEKAKEGGSVVRLKGGDPFIFGRGGEEAQFLSGEGIPYEIVPGITSAISVPAYAGIPLTQRHISSSVAFITGHEASTKTEETIDWEKISQSVDTLVVMMGVRNLRGIVQRLLSGGKDPETPVALIEKGTMADQRTITGTLGTIEAKARAEDIKAPAITIIGRVVELREEIRWVED
ncbi:uroporphyrinogen-III C-methyltransferase [Candidatus Bathyarchaeota archaeon]|nr:uroporphyrinogen-III C-methyltransferase [Candidatus Bathyarchaeota archaeon]MDP6049232.1 uroporphyrinogen-III C-methyltransferase [Candidatus Bathyarchaeota archaeon]MDP7207542.1 uroporphyrinogen-III C-methyltransferase [Candidatus Bathyarchaeota archaeon]